jgi:hypothetical protein
VEVPNGFAVVWLAVVLVQGPSREPVPFSLVGNHLVVVTGEIGGIAGLNMVVDTGTARTVIDERVAARLNLHRHPGGLEVFGTRVASDRVVLDTLAFGPIHARGLEALVADLDGQRKRFGVRIDALLGVDVLRGTCVAIDYASRRLAADCTTPLPLRAPFRPPLPVVEVSVDGHAYRLIADTGSEAIAIFRSSIPANARIVVDGKVSAGHLTGAVELTRFTSRATKVAGHCIGQPPVFILDDNHRALGYDGVLGARWLTASKVQFDMINGLVLWEEPDASATAEQRRSRSCDGR